MDGISSLFSNVFGGGGGGGFQPTDINMPPTGSSGIPGTIPLGVPTDISSAATGAAASAPTWQKLLTGGMLGAGELGNLLTQHKSNAYQNYLLNLAKNPAQLSQMVNQATQPLSNALVSAVTNQVQGSLASRGLAQSPGIFNTVQSQALAPYIMDEQQRAQSQVMQALGLPMTANVTNPQQNNLTSAMQMFLRAFQPQGLYKPTTPVPGTQTQTQTTPGLSAWDLPDMSAWPPTMPSYSPTFNVGNLTNPFMTGTTTPTFDLSGLNNLTNLSAWGS